MNASARLRLVAPRNVLALALALPALLFVARLFPAGGAGAWVRLVLAAALVLLLPGAGILRVTGWPASLGVSLASAFAWSLVAVGAALAATFAVGASLRLTIGLLVVATLGVLAPGRGPARPNIAKPQAMALGLLFAATIVYAACVDWTAGPLRSDELIHAGRVEKLTELPSLSGLNVVDEFRDGGLHPGYAFPLWHGAVALVTRLAGLDTGFVMLHLPTVLVILAVALAYIAGQALFRSWVGGFATAVAYLAEVRFQGSGIGALEFLSSPASAARNLLVPAVLALSFAYVSRARRPTLAALAAAALALTLIHVSYTVFVGVVLVGYLAARLLLSRRRKASLARFGTALLAVGVPFALALAWLLPLAHAIGSFTPSGGQQRFDVSYYAPYVDRTHWGFRLSPGVISAGGPARVAGLLAIPLAALASRRRWAAFVLGSGFAVLAILLVSPLFTGLSDVLSLSQSRRLSGYVPVSFALAGLALLAGRLRLVGTLAMLAAGIALALAFPTGRISWVAWVAFAGTGFALAFATRFPGRLAGTRGAWAALAALALCAPLAWTALARLHSNPPDPGALTPGLVHVLKTDVPRGDVVFSDPETSLRILAVAPVYVVAVPPTHVAMTAANRPIERARIARQFFGATTLDAAGREKLLRTSGADWVVVNETRPAPRAFLATLTVVYDDRHYAVYRVSLGKSPP